MSEISTDTAAAAPAPAPEAAEQQQQQPKQPQQQAPNPAATGAELAQRFPALFGGAPKPLKLRIQADIQERAPGVFSKQALSAFFRRYTGSTSYLIAVTKAQSRFDLDGQPAGELSEEHRKIAADELTRRRARNEERRAVEQEQRRNRANLLRDFERTTLTVANFCALKGVAPEELEGILALARQEAAEQPPREQRFDRGQRRPDGRGADGQDRRREGRGDGRPGPKPHHGKPRSGKPQNNTNKPADKPHPPRDS
jgi:hypothetical protein